MFNDITGEVVMDKKFLKYIGHDLYNVKKLKERKRYIVFRIRCGLHKSQIGALLDFFQTTPLRREMLKHTTSFVEQTTRAFFYKGSTWDERIAIVKNHIEYMENIFTRKVEQLDEVLEAELTKSLNSLGSQLVTISEKFADDYTPLADKLKEVVTIVEGVK